jgi:hypothetical protein
MEYGKKNGWAQKSSDGEGVLTWSVLSLVAIVDPHTSDSRHPYFYPRKRLFIVERERGK